MRTHVVCRVSFGWFPLPARQVSFTARFAVGTMAGLMLFGCHREAEEDFSRPVALPPQVATSAKPTQPAQTMPPQADAAVKNIPASDAQRREYREAGVSVSAPTSSPAGSIGTAYAGVNVAAAVRKPERRVDLRSLRLPTVNPNALVVLEPGIAIGEPKPEGGNAQLAAFGAGCARWLNFAVGGSPGMGRTPVWASAQRFEIRRKRANYQLVPEDAPALYNILGVTCAAVGKISGEATHSTLSWQLYTVPGGKPVGSPFTLSGTQEQIAAGLPQLGSRMANALNPHTKINLPPLGAGSGDLTALGGLPWTEETPLTSEQMQTARALAPRLAPAGMLLLTSRLMDDADAQQQVVDTLLQQGRDNGLVLAELAMQVRARPQEIADAIGRNAALRPNTYLFMGAGTRLMRTLEKLPEERRFVTRATRVSPHNVNAWLARATCLAEIGDALRRGRTVNMLSPSDWDQLHSVYKEQLEAAQKAAETDPQNGGAWLAVAKAGTFAGAKSLAQSAFWKSLELDKTDPDVYWWGLQMFQPKWGGRPEDLQIVADNAVDAPLKSMAQRRRIAENLKMAGCEAQSESLYRKMQADAEAAAARDANNPQAHYDLAVCYEAIKRDAQATREYKTVVALRPDEARFRYDLGEHYMRRGRYKDAAREFQETLRLSPNWGRAHLHLGMALKDDGKGAEAEPELRRALTYPLSDLDAANVHFALAKLRIAANRLPEAVKEFQASVEASPFSSESYGWLSATYAEMKQYKQAIATGLRAEQLDPFSISVHDTLSYAYAMTNQPELSIVQCRKALQLNDNDVVAHENMGDELYKLGQKEAAREEWQTAARLAPDSPSGKEAQANLAKK